MCDLVNIVRVLGLLARGVYMMCLCHCLTGALVSRQLLCSVISSTRVVAEGLEPRTVKLLGGG